ncbi:hypothetical protein [Candidatus Ichthyocystis hellenicum]|uniref:hypothetical protein n=2 Tax=Candidatus Ichthyocystis TaxID=2929841 RepID=UPI00111289F6|nr:hypothetical protein [Candidatus Ichthyocystis hellenicum]
MLYFSMVCLQIMLHLINLRCSVKKVKRLGGGVSLFLCAMCFSNPFVGGCFDFFSSFLFC